MCLVDQKIWEASKHCKVYRLKVLECKDLETYSEPTTALPLLGFRTGLPCNCIPSCRAQSCARWPTKTGSLDQASIGGTETNKTSSPHPLQQWRALSAVLFSAIGLLGWICQFGTAQSFYSAGWAIGVLAPWLALVDGSRHHSGLV